MLGLLPPPNKEFSDLPFVSGNALTGVRYISGPGENVGADAKPLPATRGGAPMSSTGDAATNGDGEEVPLTKGDAVALGVRFVGAGRNGR